MTSFKLVSIFYPMITPTVSSSSSHRHTQRWTYFLLGLSVLCLLAGPVGCKSKKKLAEEQAKQEAEAKRAKVAKLKSDLQALMATPVEDMADLEAREARLAEIRAMNIDDAGLDTLIRKVEYFLQQERERLDREMAPTPIPVRDPADEAKTSLNRYFSAVSNARSDAEANRQINMALDLFASDQAPVLIVISEQGGLKDYDKPTTILKYLNYLKDQRKNPDRVSDVVLDSNGKIMELELAKEF